MKIFKIGFRGTVKRVLIEASTMKKAKELFAKMEGVRPSGYIVAEHYKANDPRWIIEKVA